MGEIIVTNRKLLAATALSTTALIFLASAAPAIAQTPTPPVTSDAPPGDATTNSTQPTR